MIFLISESVSVTREQKKKTEGVLTNLSVIKTVIYFVSNFSAISARQKGRVSIIITSRNGKLMAATLRSFTGILRHEDYKVRGRHFRQGLVEVLC